MLRPELVGSERQLALRGHLARGNSRRLLDVSPLSLNRCLRAET